jgi:putative oxidoreductase
MGIATTVVRILLGLLFTLMGAFSFILASGAVAPPPPPPGLAAQFTAIFFQSHWVLFVAAIQLISGILLLVNRYVVLAIVMLGAVLYNILVFHLTMNPEGFPLAIVAFALWLFTALQYRSHLAMIFTPKVEPDVRA